MNIHYFYDSRSIKFQNDLRSPFSIMAPLCGGENSHRPKRASTCNSVADGDSLITSSVVITIVYILFSSSFSTIGCRWSLLTICTHLALTGTMILLAVYSPNIHRYHGCVLSRLLYVPCLFALTVYSPGTHSCHAPPLGCLLIWQS